MLLGPFPDMHIIWDLIFVPKVFMHSVLLITVLFVQYKTLLGLGSIICKIIYVISKYVAV